MYQNVYKYDEMKRSEHMAVRETVGWYYWTHHLIEVTGPDAAAFLDKVCANPIANLAVGRDRYTTMLNENGEIRDDVVVMHVADGVYWVSTLFAKEMTAWFDAQKGDMDIRHERITRQWDMYAVQGPKALELVNAVVDSPVDDMKFFSVADNTMDGIPVKVNRAGFTGEKCGYEIYLSPEHDDAIEAKLIKCGEPLGAKRVTEFQIMAMTLPTEAGFYYLRDLMHTNPFEVGLDKGIGWSKEFIGKEALLKVREEGPKREMVGFVVEQADVQINHKGFGGRPDPVLVDGERVGWVSKFTYSFVKDINIGYILADKGALKVGDKVMIHGYEGEIVEKPFI